MRQIYACAADMIYADWPHANRGQSVALTGKIRGKVRSTRFYNVLLVLCFLAAQLMPTAFAASAAFDDADYMVICTADGFKKVPLSELGLDGLSKRDAGSQLPSQQECPICVLMCVHGLADVAPHVAVVWLPQSPQHQLLRDDRLQIATPVVLNSNISPRAPPTLV